MIRSLALRCLLVAFAPLAAYADDRAGAADAGTADAPPAAPPPPADTSHDTGREVLPGADTTGTAADADGAPSNTSDARGDAAPSDKAKDAGDAASADPAELGGDDDAIDLATLTLDPTGADTNVTIGGFADVSFRTLLIPGSSLAANQYPKESTFLIGNVNLYLTKRIASRWRSFLEIRFLYAPAGTKNADGTFVHTSAADAADLERQLSWGGVSIERAYLEYEVNDYLSIQAGAFLSPYGIWNVDHGSPAIIPVFRPYTIGQEMIPNRQTGLHLFGSKLFGDYNLRYHATVSNGRGPFQAFRDLDHNKALGGHVSLETPWLDGVRIGASGYVGRYTDRPADVVQADANGNLVNTTPPGVSFDEVGYGADLRVRYGGWYGQAEVMANYRRFRPGQRRAVSGGYEVDGREIGGYALVGYRFDRFWHIMPFVEWESIAVRPSPTHLEAVVHEAFAGLNFRPVPTVALKVNYATAWVTDSAAGPLSFTALMTQAAWAF